MKFLGVLLLFSCVLAVAYSAKRCQEQADCEEHQCCVDLLFFRSPFCEKRYKPNEWCNTASRFNLLGKGLFYAACPCVDGYSCLGKGELDENGNTVIKDPKCIIPL